jgi:hypothetical protein
VIPDTAISKFKEPHIDKAATNQVLFPQNTTSEKWELNRRAFCIIRKMLPTAESKCLYSGLPTNFLCSFVTLELIVRG